MFGRMHIRYSGQDWVLVVDPRFLLNMDEKTQSNRVLRELIGDEYLDPLYRAPGLAPYQSSREALRFAYEKLQSCQHPSFGRRVRMQRMTGHVGEREQVLRSLRRAASLGVLVACPVSKVREEQRRVRRARVPEQSKAPGAPVAESKPLDALELVLLDDTQAPVAHAHFEVLANDGSVHTGVTDAEGYARLERITAGSCQLRFKAWDSGAVEQLSQHSLS